jgi:hypothetical protein
MYTRTTSLPILYIRNIIPNDMGIPSPAALANRGGVFGVLASIIPSGRVALHHSHAAFALPRPPFRALLLVTTSGTSPF